MSDSVFDFSNLDFTSMKESLKKMLKSQDEFKDFDFEGSSISILLDTLVYSSMYDKFYAHMTANESFLDTAQLRDSVVSRAKHIGYTPRSARCSIMKMSFTVVGDENAPQYITLNSSNKFRVTLTNDGSYVFQPIKTRTIYKNSDNNYEVEDLEVYSGVELTETFTTTSDIYEIFVLANKNVDETTVRMTVLDNTVSEQPIVYNRHEDLIEVKEDSKVYFLSEHKNGKLAFQFGDNVIGKKPSANSTVSVSYLIAQEHTNGKVKSITSVSSFSSYLLDPDTIVISQQPSGWKEPESMLSIKKLAPQSYEAQNRGVTRRDIESIVQRHYTNVQFVRAWGGEDNVPAAYGRVFVSVKPLNGDFLSVSEKQNIVTNILEPRGVVGLEYEMVDAEFLRLVVECFPRYKSTETDKTKADIENLVFDAILKFEDEELNGYGDDFRFSRLVKAIDAADSSIVSNITTVKIRSRLFPVFNTKQTLNVNFNNALDKGDANNGQSAIVSSKFKYQNVDTYMADDGMGNINYVRTVEQKQIIVKKNVGTVDYTTGKLIVRDFLIPTTSGSFHLDFIATPADRDVEALNNQIVVIDEEDITVTAIDDIEYKRGSN